MASLKKKVKTMDLSRIQKKIRINQRAKQIFRNQKSQKFKIKHLKKWRK